MKKAEVHRREELMEPIFTRDQRTTSHRVLDAEAQSNNMLSRAETQLRFYGANCNAQSLSHMTSLIPYSIAETTRTVRKNAQRHLSRDSYLDDRRKQSNCTSPFIISSSMLWVGVLVILLLITLVRSAPIMSLEKKMSTPPKWVNPCGLAAETFEGDLDVVQLQDDQLLQQVVVQARTALSHAKLFRDNYVQRTWKAEFQDTHASFMETRCDWLPQIPKNLGEKLDQKHLDALNLDTALLDAYEYMQKYAVGLEQIVWDQEELNLEFHKEFQDTEYELRTVLCELQVALVERGVTPRPDVTRDAMSLKYRAMASSETYRNLRDWLIFRDYMNGLEYVEQVFEHLRKNLRS